MKGKPVDRPYQPWAPSKAINTIEIWAHGWHFPFWILTADILLGGPFTVPSFFFYGRPWRIGRLKNPSSLLSMQFIGLWIQKGATVMSDQPHKKEKKPMGWSLFGNPVWPLLLSLLFLWGAASKHPGFPIQLAYHGRPLFFIFMSRDANWAGWPVYALIRFYPAIDSS